MIYQSIKHKSVSIVVPAYNETNLLKRIHFIQQELNEHFENIEIIIICDGTGSTPVEKLKTCSDKNVKIYHYPNNQGKGFALKLGTFKSCGNYIVFIDAGMELHPGDIKKFMLLMEAYEVDIVIGSKRHPLSQIDYAWYRKILSFGYQTYISILLGLKFVKDTQVGLKIFKREILQEVLPETTTSGYSFDIELLALAHKIPNIRIIEAPVTLKMWQKEAKLRSELFRLVKMTMQMVIDTSKIVYKIRFRMKKTKVKDSNWGLTEEFIKLKPINHFSIKDKAQGAHKGLKTKEKKAFLKVSIKC